jgi:Type II secretion system (T2SS), protein G
MRYRLRTLLMVLALALSPMAVGCSVVHVISPNESTLSAIIETVVRIHIYMLAHRTYPTDLNSLPLREGYVNQITDGWGKDLIYSVDDHGVISLTSLGRDGKTGGSNDDADITKRYRTRNEDGSLNIDDELWLVESEIQEDVPR